MHREEAGTPNVMASIRCGLAFHLRARVGTETIELAEGLFARRAVLRLKRDSRVHIIGEHFSNIQSASQRLSITSFNVFVPGTSFH